MQIAIKLPPANLVAGLVIGILVGVILIKEYEGEPTSPYEHPSDMLDDVVDTRTLFSADGLEASPAWDGIGSPPLPVDTAMDIGRAFVAGRQPELTNIWVHSVVLHPVWDDKVKDRWYYQVNLGAELLRDDTEYYHYFNVIVLMDGIVVKIKK